LLFGIVTEWAVLIDSCSSASFWSRWWQYTNRESGMVVGWSLQAWLCIFLYYDCLFWSSM